MDIAKALTELRKERDDLDQAILSLERLASGRPRGRGRPPGRTTGPRKKPRAFPAHVLEAGGAAGEGTILAAHVSPTSRPTFPSSAIISEQLTRAKTGRKQP